MESVQIQISPRMTCPCGKSFIPLNAEEREAYNDAVRRIEGTRSQIAELPAGKDEASATARETTSGEISGR